MSAQNSETGSFFRRSRPGRVQTSSQAGLLSSPILASASSLNCASSSSQHASPSLSAENVNVAPASGGFAHVSLDPSWGPDNAEPFPALVLGESAVPYPNPSLIRRISSKARGFARTRRQSSTAPRSRTGSVGPAILRRRSDSNNTAPPPETSSYYPDSDEDITVAEEGEDLPMEDVQRECPSTSNSSLVDGPTTPLPSAAESVTPHKLLRGDTVLKVSKRKQKEILLVLDPEAATIHWDKSRSSKCIPIDDIKDVRVDTDIRQYLLDFEIDESCQDRFFSILYAVGDKSKSKFIHLIAKDKEAFEWWTKNIDAISKHRQDLMASLMSFNDKAIRAYWNSEMAKRFQGRPHSPDEEDIDLPGVERVCRDLHIHVVPREIQTKFFEAENERRGRLKFTEFQNFVHDMKRRLDIRTIYEGVASDPVKGITWPEFKEFLREVQGENVDQDLSWKTKFLRFVRRPKTPRDVEPSRDDDTNAPRMNEAAFASYLSSTYNVPIPTTPSEYVLDRPANEYFISSSHNTYLLGRQVADVSSTEGYISSLVKGCRSIEIDCWDGSDGQPLVQHGFAMTNAISFREVINVVNKYAFTSSPYPLWVSLEVHCNNAQQLIMANIIKEVFGPSLVTEPLDDSSDKLPSPSQLIGRILIKVKLAAPDEARKGKGATSNGRRRGSSLPSPYTKPVAGDLGSIPTHLLSSSPMISPLDSSRRWPSIFYNTIPEGEVHDTVSSTSSDGESGGEGPPVKKKTSKVVPELGNLGVYCAGVKFDNFQSLECKMPYHILSFMEGTFRSNATKSRDFKDAIFRHNMRYMMRVYPQYTRISSHNFNPLIHWRKGVQMSALNWQTYDLGMQLNQAMFSGGTDYSGYVLKPHSMREIEMLPNGLPQEAVGKLRRKSVKFSVNIISAQQLMRPNSLPSHRTFDPYVEIQVYHANDKRHKIGNADDKAGTQEEELRSCTRVVRENGFNPIFDHKGEFHVTTKFPELVFVQLNVKASPDGESTRENTTPLATYSAKLRNLNQGYRTLPLYNADGDKFMFSTLFCRFKIEPVTDVYLDQPENPSKFKSLGSKVFSRPSSNSISRSSGNKSFEKQNGSDSAQSETAQPLLSRSS